LTWQNEERCAPWLTIWLVTGLSLDACFKVAQIAGMSEQEKPMKTIKIKPPHLQDNPLTHA
jgi:hypothetical protein